MSKSVAVTKFGLSIAAIAVVFCVIGFVLRVSSQISFMRYQLKYLYVKEVERETGRDFYTDEELPAKPDLKGFPGTINK